MEKLVYVLSSDHLSPERSSASVLSRLAAASTSLRTLEVLTCDAKDGFAPSVLVSAWVSCLDRRNALEDALRLEDAHVHGYLVTESVRGPREPLARGRTIAWITQAPSFGQNAWLSEVSGRVRSYAREASVCMTRDVVVRPLDVSAPPARVIVSCPGDHRAFFADTFGEFARVFSASLAVSEITQPALNAAH